MHTVKLFKNTAEKNNSSWECIFSLNRDYLTLVIETKLFKILGYAL